MRFVCRTYLEGSSCGLISRDLAPILKSWADTVGLEFEPAKRPMEKIKMALRCLSVLFIAALFAETALVLGQVTFRQLYLSGNVVLEDGSPPPEPARIELVCGGRIQPQAYTAENGGFNFAVGGSQAERINAGDADSGRPSPKMGSVGEDRSHVSMADCEVRAVVAGYRSSTIKLGRRSVFENPDIGTIVLSSVEEHLKGDPLVSVSVLKAPEKARESYAKAEQELLKENPDAKKASKELGKAVKEYPEFAAAWNLLGEARLQMGDPEGASEAFKKAIESEPGFASPYVPLVLLELTQGNLKEAAAISEEAISLVPEMADARYYHGVCYAYLGDLDKAVTSLEMVRQSPDAARFPRTHYLLGTIAAQTGEVETAVTHFRHYLELEADSKAAETVRQQLDQWKATGLIQ